MREVEKKLVGCFVGGRSCVLSNRDRVEELGTTTKYLLWGNNIFSWHKDLNEVVFCFKGWQSQTTKSRVNALLSAFGLGGVYQKNGQLVFILDNVSYNVGSSDKVFINTENKKVEIVR